MVGVRAARSVLAINTDPGALVFDAADVGIVGDWHEVLPLLVREIQSAPSRPDRGQPSRRPLALNPTPKFDFGVTYHAFRG